MTERQKELYELAKTFDEKEFAFLICSYLEHINKSCYGFRLEANPGYFVGEINYYYA